MKKITILIFAAIVLVLTSSTGKAYAQEDIMDKCMKPLIDSGNAFAVIFLSPFCAILASLDKCIEHYNINIDDITAENFNEKLSQCKADKDGDDVYDYTDNCIDDANKDQLDTDKDGKGNACEADDDADTILDVNDNCPLVANKDQTDTDGDGKGDACDGDDDNDGIANDKDNCPSVKNEKQEDSDEDGIGDACVDSDEDGIPDPVDNCVVDANEDQADFDEDGEGDICDDDIDGDEIKNDVDNCVAVVNPDQEDEDEDGIGDACDANPGESKGITTGGSGGDCSLNPSATANGFRTLLDLAIFAIPLLGFSAVRRKK